MQLIKTYQFEAAHRTPWQGNDSCLHGHSYEVAVVVEGPLDPAYRWVMDYGDISDQFAPLFVLLDHKTLNDVEGLEIPTITNLEKWVYHRLKATISLLTDVHVRILGDQVFSPSLQGYNKIMNLSERVRFGFEAAHALPKLPPEHKCYAMHGHSFEVDVAVDDTSSLAPNLQTIYDKLDHQCLNEISGLENPTSEEVSRWIWNELKPVRSDLKTVIVAETCTARCVYHGE
jgi:6-pyruvoyltetrahydropterin/6-carboxytetrahydropterin synthase